MVTLITAAFAVIAPVPCCAIVTVCGTSGLISDLRTTCSQCDCVAAGASAAETQRSCSSAPHQPALVECPFCRGTFRVWTDTSSSAGVTTAQRVVLLVAAVETLVDAGWRASPLAGYGKTRCGVTGQSGCCPAFFHANREFDVWLAWDSEGRQMAPYAAHFQRPKLLVRLLRTTLWLLSPGTSSPAHHFRRRPRTSCRLKCHRDALRASRRKAGRASNNFRYHVQPWRTHPEGHCGSGSAGSRRRSCGWWCPSRCSADRYATR